MPVGGSGEEGEPSEARGIRGLSVAEEGRIARQRGWCSHSEACPREPLREAAGGPAGEFAALGKPLRGRSPCDGRTETLRMHTYAHRVHLEALKRTHCNLCEPLEQVVLTRQRGHQSPPRAPHPEFLGPQVWGGT